MMYGRLVGCSPDPEIVGLDVCVPSTLGGSLEVRCGDFLIFIVVGFAVR